jgi:hypothetical protein
MSDNAILRAESGATIDYLNPPARIRFEEWCSDCGTTHHFEIDFGNKWMAYISDRDPGDEQATIQTC